MRLRSLLMFSALAAASLAVAQHDMHSKPAGADPLRTGLGAVHHKVSTNNALAQRYFDQGLALYYGFNHNASARSFRHAYELDSHLAMAHWGVALALGPNINMDVTPDNEKEAYKEIQQAKAVETTLTPEEASLIAALAARYSNEDKPDLGKLGRAYSTATATVSHELA